MTGAAGRERKRILYFITRLNNGGPAKIVVWLAARLDREKFETVVITGTAEKNEDEIFWFARKYGVEPMVVPWLRRSMNPLRDFAAVFRFYSVLVRVRPDILHTHMSKAGFIGRCAAVLYNRFHRKKIRLVHTFHGHVFHSYFGELRGRVFVRIERMLARRTDALIAISNRQREEIRGTYGIGKEERFHVVPLGVDFTPRNADANVRVGRHGLRIGMLGRIAPVKNYPLTVEIAAEMKKRGLDAQIVVAGGGSAPDLEKLRGIAAARSLEKQIRFVGSVTDPERFWGEMDLALITSLNEGTPVSLIEAMLSGLPFVAPAVGGIPDMTVGAARRRNRLQRYDNAVLVDGFAAEDFADAVALFLDDGAYRRDAGMRGREWAQREYRLERLQCGSQTVYDEVLR